MLVIIGLIVGGVLVGQSLIASAGARAQVTQVMKFQSAVNTFRGKYNHLPGDISDPDATSFGFTPRAAYPGWGNDDGIISGLCGASGLSNLCGYGLGAGEATLFWVDLSTANLIEGNFNTATPGTYPSSVTNIPLFFPQAKIGRGNYVYVWSGGYYPMAAQYPGDGHSYFGLSAITSIGATAWQVNSTPALTVSEALSIDKKIDDGLPQSGRVQAMYVNYAVASGATTWAAGGGGTAHGASNAGLPTVAAVSSSSTTCYDNGGNGGIQNYSVTTNNGAGVNCAISFMFQ